jgi:hypothetical protein
MNQLIITKQIKKVDLSKRDKTVVEKATKNIAEKYKALQIILK